MNLETKEQLDLYSNQKLEWKTVIKHSVGSYQFPSGWDPSFLLQCDPLTTENTRPPENTPSKNPNILGFYWIVMHIPSSVFCLRISCGPLKKQHPPTVLFTHTCSSSWISESVPADSILPLMSCSEKYFPLCWNPRLNNTRVCLFLGRKIN